MNPVELNLAIDGRPLVGNRTGIGVHTAEIASRLTINPAPLIASHAPIADRQGIEHCRFFVDPAPFGVWWQLFTLARVVERERCDVLWGPHGTLPPGTKVPAVVSVHDLTSITAPHRHRLRTIASFNLLIRHSLEHASFIAAVSRITADEVVRGFALERQKVVVVPNGVDPFFSPGADAALGPYLLYVGTLEPRKGVDDLFAVWKELGRVPRLVIAGDPGWGHYRLRRQLQNHIAAGKITIEGFVSRERLRELYRGALCLVYPSRYEGFGLPPLEAMACGTPVIASTGGAIPEVVGEAALLFPAGDLEKLRSTLTRVIQEASLRAELRGKGLRRAAEFRWETSAALMQELLQRAAAQ